MKTLIKRAAALILAAVILLLSGCGVEMLQEMTQTRQMPDENVVLHRQLRYFAQEMDRETYLNMCAYYEAAINFEKRCYLPYPMTQTELEQLITLTRYECPELMMLEVSRSFSVYTTNEKATAVEMPYSMDKQDYEEKLSQTRSVIDELVEKCRGLTAAEQEKLVYDHIVTNSIYDEHAPWAGTAYGCLVEGRAKCDGFSFAMKWIMEELGIPCMIIAGNPTDGGIGHAWNVIKLDGQWYDLDVTADVSREEHGMVTYPAYNVSDSWIRQLYELNSAYERFGDIPGAADMTGSYHGLAGCYVPEGAEDRLEELYMEAYEDESSFVLQFESKEDFEAFEAEITDRLDMLGRNKGLHSWSWSVYSIPDYRTICIHAGKS